MSWPINWDIDRTPALGGLPQPVAAPPPSASLFSAEDRARYPGQALMADIAMEQYDDYLARYRPFEQSLVSQALAPFDPALGQAAAADGRRAATVADAAFARNMGRSGIAFTEEMKRAHRGRSSRNRALAEVGGRNLARRAHYDRRLNLLSGLASYGRGLATGATRNAGQLSALERGRRQDYLARKDSYTQNKYGTIGRLIGVAAGSFL